MCLFPNGLVILQLLCFYQDIIIAPNMSHKPCNFSGYNYPDSLALETQLYNLPREVYENCLFITLTSWWARWRLKSPASRLFTQPFIRVQIKENIKAPRHWLLRGEFTGDRWIPRTKGQWRGKCFHLMTSSCMEIRRKWPCSMFPSYCSPLCHAILIIQWSSDQQNEKKRTFVFQYIFISILWKFALSRDQ